MNESFRDLVKDKQIIAIVDSQWGDTGKGKFVDYFSAYWADVIARGTGGNNAGHTVVIGDEKRVFHLLPSGITYKDKINILGNGMVIDIEVLCSELDDLINQGITDFNLMISEHAHVILPYHVEQDKKRYASQNNKGIGSTGRGIGPCYTDKVSRRGVMIRDLYHEVMFKEKLAKLSTYYPNSNYTVQEVFDQLKPFIDRIKPYVKHTLSEIHKLRKKGKKILLEGAQGLLLSIEFGSYPYVTTSDCSLNGTASGVGLRADLVDMTFNIVKFPFMTRVGGGPFPTELGGEASEVYCAHEENTYKKECKEYGVLGPTDPKVKELMNAEDDFEKGVGVRLAANEYGATTGRARRCGWTDLMLLKFAIDMNGPNLILTKTDAISGMKVFSLCQGYEGFDYSPRSACELQRVNPQYTHFKGFDEDISPVTSYSKLPESLREAIDFLEEQTEGKVRIVSVGPEQNQTIIKD